MSGDDSIYGDLSTADFEGLTVQEAEALLDLAEATHNENQGGDEEQVYDENGPVAPNV